VPSSTTVALQEELLKRPEQRLAHGLTPEAIDEFVAEPAALIEPLDIFFLASPNPRSKRRNGS
jgi:hypothetical protein